MTDLAMVLDWKFPGVQGICTVDGQVTQFPGGIPTQAELDQWTDEYNNRPPDVPRSINQRQCRLQLLATPFPGGATGLDAVDQAISGMSKQAQVDWEYAEEIKRDYPLVVGIQQLFQWSDEQTDTFFAEAAKL